MLSTKQREEAVGICSRNGDLTVLSILIGFTELDGFLGNGLMWQSALFKQNNVFEFLVLRWESDRMRFRKFDPNDNDVVCAIFEAGNTELLRFLLEKNESNALYHISITNEALKLACVTNDEFIDYVLSQTDPKHLQEVFHILYIEACTHGYLNIVKRFILQLTQNNPRADQVSVLNTGLILAALNEQLELVNFMLDLNECGQVRVDLSVGDNFIANNCSEGVLLVLLQRKARFPFLYSNLKF